MLGAPWDKVDRVGGELSAVSFNLNSRRKTEKKVKRLHAQAYDSMGESIQCLQDCSGVGASKVSLKVGQLRTDAKSCTVNCAPQELASIVRRC